MINSMTGYGKSSLQNEDWTLDCEIRTVNNRYLDIKVKLPSMISGFEQPIKEEVRNKLNRGRVDVNLYFKPAKNVRKASLNSELLSELVDEYRAFQASTGLVGDLPMESFIRLEGVVSFDEGELDEEALWTDIRSVLGQALGSLLEMRRAEGENLKADLTGKLDELRSYRNRMQERSPQLVEEEYKRLRENVETLLADLHRPDEQALATEIAILAQKLDINEELVRLSSHIDNFEMNLSGKGAVGKTLDFIIQEMNREVNTVSSKSTDIEMREACIAQKAIIEQLREQIQNIE